MIRVAVAAVTMLAIAAPAAAAVVVDTDALIRASPESQGIALQTVGRLAPPPGRPEPVAVRQVQSFTAGLAGRLDGIELQIFRSTNFGAGTLRLSLIDGDYLAGARNVVGIGEFSVADIRPTTSGRLLEPLLRFDTGRFGLEVTPGSSFSVQFEVIPAGDFSAAALLVGDVIGTEMTPEGFFRPIVVRSDYAGGALVFINANGSPQLAGSNDIGFRTFVEAAAVPELASWVMLLGGFSITGLSIRRRRAMA